MSEEESTTDWAQLVCLTDAETPPFLIGKDKFTIGRAKGCDIAHDNNKLVSGIHCYILRDDSGKVWLYDTSTNGTLLNSSIKLTKGQCQEIEHGDEFYVVHKKGEEDVNIGYVYQDLAKLKEEEANDSGDLEQTLEYEDEAPQVDATLADDSINQVHEELRAAVKRKPPPSEMGPGPSSKKPRAGQSRADSIAAADSRKNNPQTASKQGQGKEEETEKGGGEKTTGKKGKRKEEVKGAEKDEKEGEKVKKDGGKGENDKMEEVIGGEKDKKEEEKVASKSAGKSGAGEEDAIAETLTCIICQEILHDCISLQPCMHSFCSGCYSEWMAHSKECPSCRGNVDRINKNHIVNNLVEAYLKEHPDKKRPEEDIKELNAKNKVTRDMLYQKIERDSSEYEDSDAAPDEDEDEEDDQPVHYPPPAPAFGQVFGFGTPFFGATTNAFRAICRQCPGQAGSQATSLFGAAVNKIKTIFTGDQSKPAPTTTTVAATTTTAATPSTSGNNNNNNNNDTNNNTDQPGTSGAGPSGAEEDHQERDKKTLPDAPDYTCGVQQNHVMCQCCLQIFPDRRQQRITQPEEIPPQQCTICFRAYCHAYWGCRKADCNGCLAKLKDMNFGRKVLPGLILENPSESDIFTRYLDSKKIALRDVLENCLAKLEEGSYSCPDQLRFTITGETPLCYACALRNFKVLAYQYRADVPNDQLPAEAKNRNDCYWGKECRTQRNKPAHAMRFNHVCEQTRT